MRLLACLGLLPLFVTVACAHDDLPDDTSRVIVTGDCPGGLATVTTATYVGTDLTVTATYGGCAPSRTWACWNGLYVTSDPPQAQVVVHHDHEAVGECAAIVTQIATISLTPIVDGRDGAAQPLDRVILSVGGTQVDWQR